MVMLVFILAGTVKGVIGLGLPTISLALLSVLIDLPSAMALMLIPSLVTNVWQAIDGKYTRLILIRIWPFLIMATLTVWIGGFALARFQPNLLSALLGALLITYAVPGITGYRPSISTNKEPWLGPGVGAINGVLTGMTGSFVVPGVMYLQALGLSRDALIQAMGMLFTASTLSLALVLGDNGLLSMQLGTSSALAVAPAMIGMHIGRHIRRQLSEHVFRRVFFIALMLLGAYIMVSNVLSQ